MKKFLTAIALLGSTSLVHADYTVVASDGSELSKLCVAVATADSRASALAATTAAGITSSDLPYLRCNGRPIMRYAARYSSINSTSLVETSTPMGYLLRKTDSSPLTELCAAAAVSDAEYAKVKESHFSNDEDIDAEVLCNGEPLKTFVRKYRNSSSTLISSR